MAIVFTRAVRENVPLLLGFSGGTGSGKTYSALRVANGLCGGKRFAVIDTESGRAQHYADDFDFDHADLKAPFRPDAYLDAIVSAEAAGYPVVVVDSMSHVWAGDGGVLDWHEDELDRMAGGDWSKRESRKMAAWIKPKLAHKRMVQRLLQLRTHVILCFRAEPKVDMVKDEKGKMVIVAKHSLAGLDGWIPVCEKMLPFELTASFLLMAAAPGVPRPIKLPRQLAPFFPLDKPITEAAGAGMASWAGGEKSLKAENGNQSDFQIDELFWAWSEVGESKAAEGLAALGEWWKGLPAGKVKTKLGAEKLAEWKKQAGERSAT